MKSFCHKFRLPGTAALFLCTGLILSLEAGPRVNLHINRERLIRQLENLAAFGGTPDGGVHRVAFSEEDKKSRVYLMSLMKEAGLTVRVDAAANIIGRREGRDPNRPAILCGSHSDTVPRGGRFDGALGVLSSIECARVLHENKIRLNHPLEIIVFTDEEGGLVGSRAVTGTLTPEALDVVSHSGKTVGEGINFLGGDIQKIQTDPLYQPLPRLKGNRIPPLDLNRFTSLWISPFAGFPVDVFERPKTDERYLAASFFKSFGNVIRYGAECCTGGFL